MPRGIPNHPKADEPVVAPVDPAPAPAPVDADAAKAAEIVEGAEKAVDSAMKAAEPVVEKVVAKAIKLVRMVRDHIEGQPSTADVHPAEVAHMAEHGWREE